MRENGARFLCAGLIMQDILLLGVNHLPSHWEETLLGKSVTAATGGGAANSAIAFGKLGADVSILGRIGEDAFGQMIIKSFLDNRVDIRQLVTGKTLGSGVAVGLVNDEGSRCFTTVRGENAALRAVDFLGIDWAEYDAVLINGYFQLPALEETLADILCAAREDGCVTAFDTASWDPSGRWYESIRPFAKHIEYFFTNEAQLAMLTGHREEGQGARFLLNEGVGNVIVKQGSRGCTAFSSDGGVCHARGLMIRPVDTTGAGDSFNAAYLLAVAKGYGKEDCGLFANAVAGLNCTAAGATAGVPNIETAMAAMKKLKADAANETEETSCH